MSYKKLTGFTLYQRAMQEADLDVLSITSSPKGFGKSSFILQNARKYLDLFGLTCPQCKHEWVYTGRAVTSNPGGGFTLTNENPSEPCPKCGHNNSERTKRFNFMRYLAYDNNEVRRLIHELPEYSPILADEGVRFMMGEDWNSWESKLMKKLIAQCRTKHLLIFTNIPKFRWLDRKYRDDMATFWVRIIKRGMAVMLQPDLGETDDPWHMKNFEKYLGSYNYFTSESVLMERVSHLLKKHQCVFDYFRIPPVPDDIYKTYLVARDAKAFEAKRADQKINEKDVAKIACYNLTEKWDEIKAAVHMGKFKKPTLKILARFVFNNPVTNKDTVAYTTIRNWIKGVDDMVKLHLGGNNK